MPEETKKSHNFFLYALLLGCLIAIGSSFYFFYYKKDYNFIVETTCDDTKETCFVRDCSNPQDCPPNQLTTFKRYSLNAGDFARCENEDCTMACESRVIKCKQIACTEDLEAGESCISPTSNNTEAEPLNLK